jgi:hypothetical protein
MKNLSIAFLALAGLMLFSSCETYDDDDDDDERYRGSTTTTTTEETTLSSPLSPTPMSSTVETQTTRTY